jgi:hypothetical protein
MLSRWSARQTLETGKLAMSRKRLMRGSPQPHVACHASLYEAGDHTVGSRVQMLQCPGCGFATELTTRHVFRGQVSVSVNLPGERRRATFCAR